VILVGSTGIRIPGLNNQQILVRSTDANSGLLHHTFKKIMIFPTTMHDQETDNKVANWQSLRIVLSGQSKNRASCPFFDFSQP
jgi:hypothetical protein